MVCRLQLASTALSVVQAVNWAQLSGNLAQNVATSAQVPWSQRWGSAVVVAPQSLALRGASQATTRVWLLGGDDFAQPLTYDAWSAPGGVTDPIAAASTWPFSRINVAHVVGSGGLRNDVWLWATDGVPGPASWRATTDGLVAEAVWTRIGFEVSSSIATGVATPTGLQPDVSTILWGGGYREWLCCTGDGTNFPCHSTECPSYHGAAAVTSNVRWSPRRSHGAVAVSIVGPSDSALGSGSRIVLMGGRARSLEEMPACDAVGGLPLTFYAGVATTVPPPSTATPTFGAAAAIDARRALSAIRQAARARQQKMKRDAVNLARGGDVAADPLRAVRRSSAQRSRAGSAALRFDAASAVTEVSVNDSHRSLAVTLPFQYTHEVSLLVSDVWSSTDGVDWQLVNPGCYVLQIELAVAPGTAMQQCAADADCFAKRLGNTACVRGMCVCRHWSPREQFALAANSSGALLLSGGVTVVQDAADRCGPLLCGGVGRPVVLRDVWASVDGGARWVQLTPLAPWAARAEHSMVFTPGITGGVDVAWLVAGGDVARALPQGVDGGGGGSRVFADIWASLDGGVTWRASGVPPWSARRGSALVANGSTLWLIAGETQVSLPRVVASPDAAIQAALAAGMASPNVATRGTTGADATAEAYGAAAEVTLVVDAVRAKLPFGTGATGEVALGNGWLTVPLSDVWVADVADFITALGPLSPSAVPSLVWTRDDGDDGVAAGAAEQRSPFHPRHSILPGGAPPASTSANVSAHTVALLAIANVTTWAQLAYISPGVLAPLLYALSNSGGNSSSTTVADVCALRALALTLLRRCAVHAGAAGGSELLLGPALDIGPQESGALIIAEADAVCNAALPLGHTLSQPADTDVDVVCSQRFAPRSGRPAAFVAGSNIFVVGGRARRWWYDADVWYRDAQAPTTQLFSKPVDGTSDSTFEFACDEPACAFECRLNDQSAVVGSGSWASCSSPFRAVAAVLAATAQLSLRFEVRAVDPAGNRDRAPVSYSWSYKPSPPLVIILPIFAALGVLLIIAYLLHRRWRASALLLRYLRTRAAGRMRRARERGISHRAGTLKGVGIAPAPRSTGASAPYDNLSGADPRAAVGAITVAAMPSVLGSRIRGKNGGGTATTSHRRRGRGRGGSPRAIGLEDETVTDLEAPSSLRRRSSVTAAQGGDSSGRFGGRSSHGAATASRFVAWTAAPATATAQALPLLTPAAAACVATGKGLLFQRGRAIPLAPVITERELEDRTALKR